MSLTSAQLTALKNAIEANQTWNAYPNNDDGNFDLAVALNQIASPAFTVWKTNVKTADILDAVDWAKYTPNTTMTDAGLATDIDIQRITARANNIQIKQMNLQLMMQGRDTLDTSKPNIRAGLRDAVIGVPTGSAGAGQSPGGVNGSTVLNVCTRSATYGEQILATDSQGSDTTGIVTARVMGFEGNLTASDITIARNLP